MFPSQSCALEKWSCDELERGAETHEKHSGRQTSYQSGSPCGHPDHGVGEHSWCKGSDKQVRVAEVLVCLMRFAGSVELNACQNRPADPQLQSDKVLGWECSRNVSLFCSADEVLFVSNKNNQLYILCLKPQQCQSLRKKRWQKKRKVSLNKLLWRMRVTCTSRESSPKSMMCRQSLCIMKMLNSARNFG